MSRPQQEEIFGPNIEFREFSFMDNPRAEALRGSVLTVEVCKKAGDGCGDGSTPPAIVDGVLKLQPGLTDKQLAAALGAKEVAGYRVLQVVGGIHRLFGGFEEDDHTNRFKMRLDGYLAIWCCIDAHPGHIWYDFFWDMNPHTDRHARPISGPWWPQTGP